MRLLLFTVLFIRLYSVPFSHECILKKVDFASPKKEIPFTGYFRIVKQTKRFFHDLGAQYYTRERDGFNGMYISYDSVRNNSGKVFGKWKQILKEPKNNKLLDVFEGNLASNNLRELFCLPIEVTIQRSALNKTAIIFLDYTVPITMQMREILNFSLRGYNVLVVDYYECHKGKFFPSWEECKKIATNACYHIRKADVIYGKSFGAAPATYLASKIKNAKLILDRPFTEMKAIAPRIISSLIKSHYSYPTCKLIKSITKHPLIISSVEDDIFKNHAIKLFEIYISAKGLKKSNLLKESNFIHTRGGHYNFLLNKGKNSWFSYNNAQLKLNKFLSSDDYE